MEQQGSHNLLTLYMITVGRITERCFISTAEYQVGMARSSFCSCKANWLNLAPRYCSFK